MRQPRHPIVALGFRRSCVLGRRLQRVYTLWETAARAPGSLPGCTRRHRLPGRGRIGTAASPLLLLLFPDGRPLSPGGAGSLQGWRSWASRIVDGLQSWPLMGTGVAVRSPSWSPNETVNGLRRSALPFLVVRRNLLPVRRLVGFDTGFVRRFRRMRGEQRLQLKWLATAGIIWASFIVIDTLTNISSVRIAINISPSF